MNKPLRIRSPLMAEYALDASLLPNSIKANDRQYILTTTDYLLTILFILIILNCLN